ncbi:hypothetical protein CHCC14566_4057 [Bacillus licheniformis]|nr:hypothetical protein CHCC14566_4057 [Bacillus licheniformis]
MLIYKQKIFTLRTNVPLKVKFSLEAVKCLFYIYLKFLFKQV